LRNLLQNLVANFMTIGVIHGFKAIEIQKHQRTLVGSEVGDFSDQTATIGQHR